MDKDPLSVLNQVKRLELVSNRLVENLFAGNYRTVFKGPGLEFKEVREYISGDDIRFIDWNVSGRMGHPYTKTFREEREMVLNLILDFSSSLWSGSQEKSRRDIAATIFSLLAYSAVANNDRVGALFFSDRVEGWVPPIKGKKHISRVIQDCLTLEPQGAGSDIAGALRTANETMKRRGIVVILSDFKTSGYQKELTLLARKHDVIAIRLTDDMEEDYPETGYATLLDPETGYELPAMGFNKSFRRQYHDYWTLNRIQWRRDCHRRRVDTLEVSTSDDPVACLIRFFERRRRR